MTERTFRKDSPSVARALSRRIPEDTWTDKYQPKTPPSGEGLWTEEEIAGVSYNKVWTAMDSELDNSIIVVPGKRWVNRIDYVVTELPWETESVVGIWAFRKSKS